MIHATFDRNRQRTAEREAQREWLADRYGMLAEDLETAIRYAFEAGSIPSIWALEGPLTHSIRAEFCLESWDWETADAWARAIMSDVHRRIGAKRPTWEEGQREWTQESGTAIERTNCFCCYKPLPEGHYKYCGPFCARQHQGYVQMIMAASNGQALDKAIRSMRSI